MAFVHSTKKNIISTYFTYSLDEVRTFRCSGVPRVAFNAYLMKHISRNEELWMRKRNFGWYDMILIIIISLYAFCRKFHSYPERIRSINCVAWYWKLRCERRWRSGSSYGPYYLCCRINFMLLLFLGDSMYV